MADILLVDDDEQLRATLQLVLKIAGYEVTDARNGVETLRRYSERPVDLVITDIIMPDKDGLELIIELRRQDPVVKIMAISGGGQAGASQYLELAQKFGASQMLAKPFSNQEILLRVQTLLIENHRRGRGER